MGKPKTELPEPIAFLKASILDTERVLEGVKDHPLMGPPLVSRLEELREDLRKIEDIGMSNLDSQRRDISNTGSTGT